MPRVHHRKARKDHKSTSGPDIKKGDKYFTWSMKTGPYSSFVGKQLTSPKQSQLTTSPFMKAQYTIQESMQQLSANVTDLRENFESIIEQVRELSEEEQEKFDNMPDGLRDGDTGQMIEERANACETWADELEQVIDRCDELDDLLEEHNDDNLNDEVESLAEEILEEFQGVEISIQK